MANAPIQSNASSQSERAPTSSLRALPNQRKLRRRPTSHLKIVPETKALRERIRTKCVDVAAKIDKSRPMSKDEMEVLVRAILKELELPEGYVGWTMVLLSSEFWRDQVAAIPPSRRLFLLPHCLKHAEGCPADYDDFGLDCESCGACSIADFRSMAEKMGYKVLVAEGSPIVLKIIVSGHVDAIVGVACLNVLEKAIDKILLAGIPCMAVPLLSSDCRNTSVDEDWVNDMIQVAPAAPTITTRSYVHLMRTAAEIFEPDALDRLGLRRRGGPRLAELNGHGLGGLHPIAATEAITYDFLGKGGKYARPFITLAVHDALSGAKGTLSTGSQHLANLPNGVKRAALAIETFHKASLVHDDIEDDDAFRYGVETLHRKYGIATAINVGDFMIGLGYRLASRDAAELGAEVTNDLVDMLADAHMKLSEGQGAELLWRDSLDKGLTAVDALKIYALKTAPAFEAALLCGARLAGSIETYREPLSQFARYLGVAFQIINDLDDWQGDQNNKMSAGGDVLGGRPTVLWALAIEGLDTKSRTKLQELIDEEDFSPSKLARVRAFYNQADVFEKASRLIDKYHQRAEAVADKIEPDELRRLLYYLIDTVLQRSPDDDAPAVITPSLIVPLPTVVQP